MFILTPEAVKQIINEINREGERTRRTYAKRRHDMYRDDGRKFLIDQLVREFGQDSIKEMRLCPVNFLKKIINKRSVIYKNAPTRTPMEKSPNDQALIDYYTRELKFNVLSQKRNRYYNLQSNGITYIRPMMGKIRADVIPPHLYSIVANPMDRTNIKAHILNSFIEQGRIATQENIMSATGASTWDQERGFKVKGDLVASNEKEITTLRQYIFWTDDEHFTTNDDGDRIKLFDEDDFSNPIMMNPCVNWAKERDNEEWAPQGEDLVDLSLVLQLGLTDEMSIAKHQGYAVPIITGPEEPKTIQVGINKAIFLKSEEGKPIPTFAYASANSSLSEYKDMMADILGMTLTSNEMDPGTISGKSSAQNFTSGFQQMISMTDTLDAIEMDKPAMMDAEIQEWEVIKRWHNVLWKNGQLDPEAAKLGQFSEGFKVSVQFGDIKPLESIDERISRVKELRGLGLITLKGSVKAIYTDLSDEKVEELVEELEEEKSEASEAMAEAMKPEPAEPEASEIPPQEQDGEDSVDK